MFGTEYNSYLNALSHTQKANVPTSQIGHAGATPRTNEEFSGGTIGGPDLKNKWFLFGGMDSDLLSGQSVFSSGSLTPTPNGLGTLAACFPTGIQAQQVTALQKFRPYSISAGNPIAPSTTLRAVGTCANVEMGGIVRTLATPFHGFDFVNRVDGQFGNDTIMGRYLFNRGNNFNGSDNPVTGYGANVTALSQAALISETHNFSSHMVNEARVGFNRLNVDFGGNNMGNPLEPTQGGILQALTNVTIQGGFLGFGLLTSPRDAW